ncbi:hypothetical protein A1O7_03955 [Cladophialophora yegresii CBS 114405]|uniref:Amidohydrolase-related domain-containing protein n=1 Tax=Cladophialophora yegresii CBS 114405 TaxID=1182544 RepID=W9VVV2_9EURO|nr:uncharacterized protein A1O7_03955 [Cladophialophora yegresii CBS 114405]EXJ59808.1 hypothetical protein A1O7_03955 [Cladophialophora yegresii CBS 114405]
MASKVPLITLEEHFISQAVVDYYTSQGIETSLPDTMSHIMTSLREVGPKRLKAMDNGRVSLQVISHRPNTIPVPPDVCKAANDELYQAINASPSPDRFAAFAMLPMLHPEIAAKELDRCVSELKFVGSLIDNTANGRFYDDQFFWPIFAAHEKLDVPVYLHAIPQPITESTPSPEFHGNYSANVSNFLANHGFHWHSEVALHVMRLFASKLFDKHRHLKLLLGHMGETLPFLIDRIHKLVQRTWPSESKPRRHLLQVWHENIYITTAGMFSLAPMACLIHMCCADKVLYSVDYPFCAHEDGVKFMHALHGSGMINDQDFEAIAYKNAERLLDVRIPNGNDVGLEVDWDESGAEGDRRRMPWLTAIDSSNSVNGDGSAFPHSPLDTVHEER